MGNHTAEKWRALLGFGFRSGKVITGTEATRSLLKKGQARLVWLAENASPRTQREFTQVCEENGVDWIVFSKKEILGLCTGQSPRAVLAIIDHQLARAILRVIRPDMPGK
ncbi:MAG: hypothetical protein GX295_00445 [Syntrophomonadaceae bacterium]|nr:hypothetical protein [Syntrophomonadaceae bacterium]